MLAQSDDSNGYRNVRYVIKSEYHTFNVACGDNTHHVCQHTVRRPCVLLCVMHALVCQRDTPSPVLAFRCAATFNARLVRLCAPGRNTCDKLDVCTKRFLRALKFIVHTYMQISRPATTGARHIHLKDVYRMAGVLTWVVTPQSPASVYCLNG